MFSARLPLPLSLQSNYQGLSGLGSPNHNFDNNAGPNRSIAEQGLLSAVPQQQPQHAVRMLELAGNPPPGTLPPNGPNGFPNGLNMNIKDNSSPSSAAESPVPPSKLSTSGGIPFQPHNLGNLHKYPEYIINIQRGAIEFSPPLLHIEVVEG